MKNITLVTLCMVIYKTLIMTNLFKRNKTYYIRLSLNDNLKIYFANKREYIKSLNTKNINDAKIIEKYLISKFNYIKRSFKMFSTQEIKEYIDEFKKTKFDDIVNRNTHLSINEIDTLIGDLNEEVDIYDEIINKEFYDLMNLIDLSNKKELEYGIDVDSAEKFKKNIIDIKINALNEVKKNIQNKVNVATPVTQTIPIIIQQTIPNQVIQTVPNQNQVIQTVPNQNPVIQTVPTSNPVIQTIPNQVVIHQTVPVIPSNYVTIEDAFSEYLNSRDKVSENHKKASEKEGRDFIKFCHTNKLQYIQELQNKNLIAYRNFLKTTKPKAKIGSLNLSLKFIIAFLNHSSSVSHYIPDITKKVKFTLSKRDKLEQKREPYSNEEYKKLLDNIDLIKLTPKKKKPTKYFNEYEIIIKIAAYTGARENEICQLTKKDILKDENNIDYINFRIDIGDNKTIKTISSFRKVPVHSELEKDLFDYINSVKTNNLFKIKSTQFSIDYGYFKTKVGFGDKHVFHSFRNTLQNKLKQQKVQFEMINEIAGHGPEDENKISADYTNPYELHILHEAIEKISYIN